MTSESLQSCEIILESPILKTIKDLTQNSSALRIRLLESNEYCKYADTCLKIMQSKIESLQSEKIHLQKTKDELQMRNKINLTNLDSLFGAQNEFYNYKCDVKANYIAAYESRKSKRMKYEKITNLYESQWEASERDYHKLPMALDLLKIQDENNELFIKERTLNQLFDKTQLEYLQEINVAHRNLINVITEFSKERQKYIKCMSLKEAIKSRRLQVKELTEELKAVPEEQTNHCTSLFEKSKEEHCEEKYPYTAVDLTAFDNMLLPMEILENQNDISFLYNKDNELNAETGANFELEVDAANHSIPLGVEDEITFGADNIFCEERNATEAMNVLQPHENYNDIIVEDDHSQSVHSETDRDDVNKLKSQHVDVDVSFIRSNCSVKSKNPTESMGAEKLISHKENGQVDSGNDLHKSSTSEDQTNEIKNQPLQESPEGTAFLNAFCVKTIRPQEEANDSIENRFSFFLNNIDSNKTKGGKSSIFNLF